MQFAFHPIVHTTPSFQASRIIHIGPHRNFPATARPESCEHDLQANADTEKTFTGSTVERIVGRVCRLERGGRVVAAAGGREVVVDGVEVRRAVLECVLLRARCQSCAAGCRVCNGLHLRFPLFAAQRWWPLLRR